MNFFEKIKHRDAGENGDLNQADFFFQVFYKLWLCGYSVLNVKRSEKLINVLMGQSVRKNETNMQMIINLNISSRSVYTWNFNLIINTKESEVAQSCPTL